jgi:hypothetical protein
VRDAAAAEDVLQEAAYGKQFPAYREDPMRETLRVVESLAADPGDARQYGEFQRLISSEDRCNH